MEKAPVERPGLFVTANIQLTIELKTFYPLTRSITLTYNEHRSSYLTVGGGYSEIMAEEYPAGVKQYDAKAAC